MYQPNEVDIPYDLPDVPAVRKEQACYYSSVRRCDDVMGGLIDLLDSQKIAKTTMLTFLSDHGMAKPTAKSNAYPQSTSTPFIIRFPDQIQPGVNSTSFVSALDLFPTILEWAGIEEPEGLGTSLMPLLKGDLSNERHDIHTQFYSIIGKKHYQMRCYQDQEFAFIYNAWANDQPIYKSSALGGEAFKAMIIAGKSDPKWKERAEFILTRSPEELYDLKNDPLCQNNLIESPEYKNKIEECRQKVVERMKRTQDYLLPLYQNYGIHGDLNKTNQEFINILKKEKVVGVAPSKVLTFESFTNKKKRKNRKKKK